MSILLPQVYTPDEVSSLTVEDWLPAGLEALDPNLDNFNGGSGGGGGAPPWPWWVCGWWRCSSFARETHKDRVRYHDRSNRTLNPSPQASKPQTSQPTHPTSHLHAPTHPTLAPSRCATSRHGRQRARTRSATRQSRRRAVTSCCRPPRSRPRSNPNPGPDPDPDPGPNLALAQ